MPMDNNEVLCLQGTSLNVSDFVWAENAIPAAEHGGASGGNQTSLEAEVFPEVDLSLSDKDLVPLLHSAAASWGCFRIFNHGVPQALMDSISAHVLRFFDLSLSDKLAVARDPPATLIGYKGMAESGVIKAWCEALHVMPGKEQIYGLLNRLPSLSDRTSFCTDLMEYFSLLGALAIRIIRLLFRGLDLDEAEVKAAFDNIDSSNMRANYYPACPVADRTYGSPAHKDYGGLAILHQDDVGGLEVLKNGHWVGVTPEKGHLIVKIGDLIQILSNGRYQSILHRSLVHTSQPRLSVVFFYFPPEDKVVAPMAKLVTKDSPAKYRSFSMGEYRLMCTKAIKAHHSPTLFFEEIP